MFVVVRIDAQNPTLSSGKSVEVGADFSFKWMPLRYPVKYWLPIVDGYGSQIHCSPVFVVIAENVPSSSSAKWSQHPVCETHENVCSTGHRTPFYLRVMIVSPARTSFETCRI